MNNRLNEEINRIKSIMKEASSTDNDLFGGKKVEIPQNGSHAGQSGWQSGNAWDIPTDIGTPVYSLTTGYLETFRDYGPSIKKVDGKKLFGCGFTVKSTDGNPDIYYTHLQQPVYRKGDHVKCGDLLGYVMDFPGSTYDHVHIGVKTGHDIRELLNYDGKIKCSRGEVGMFGTTSKPEGQGEKSSEEDDKSFLERLFSGDYISAFKNMVSPNFEGSLDDFIDSIKSIFE